MKPLLLLTTIFLALIAIGHFLRLVFHVEAVVGGFSVPMWMSVVACLFSGGLAVMLSVENRRK